MAICYPDYGEDRSAFESPGEVKFYDACKAALDANYHVFHSVAWIAHTARGEAKDGEADFVICHPDRGILVVEIKGGGVRADFRTGRWTSIDQHGVRHHISNPFRQAARGKFNVIEKLKQHRDWPRLNIRRVIAGHAAFFPDLDDARPLQGPDAPPDIIGDKTDLPILGEWMVSVFQFWSSQEDNQDTGSCGSSKPRTPQKPWPSGHRPDSLSAMRKMLTTCPAAVLSDHNKLVPTARPRSLTTRVEWQPGEATIAAHDDDQA